MLLMLLSASLLLGEGCDSPMLIDRLRSSFGGVAGDLNAW